MTIASCYKKSKGRTSYVCIRSAELRKGKTISEMSQHQAFIKANKEADKLDF
jgi:hypothetical protein